MNAKDFKVQSRQVKFNDIKPGDWYLLQRTRGEVNYVGLCGFIETKPDGGTKEIKGWFRNLKTRPTFSIADIDFVITSKNRCNGDIKGCGTHCISIGDKMWLIDPPILCKIKEKIIKSLQ